MSWTLDQGAHKRPEDGVCLMEAVAWVAGEKHSDAPECACPVLSAYGRQLNDLLPHAERQRLAVFVPRLVGSRASRDVAQVRAYRLADAACRVFAPAALEAAGERDWAERLRALAPVVDKDSANAAAAAYATAAVNAYATAAYATAAYAANATAAYATAANAAYAAANADAAHATAAYATAANADAANATAAAAAANAAAAHATAAYATAAVNAYATAAYATAQPIWDYAISLLDELLPAAEPPLVRSYAEFEAAVA